MKTIYKVLALGILMTAFIAADVTPIFAQDPQAEKIALYKKYTDNFDKPEIEKKKMAIEAGKQYIEKYPEDVDQVNYLKTAVPQLQEVVDKMVADNTYRERLKRFDAAVRGNNLAESFTLGKEVIANEKPDSTVPLDVQIVLASLGFDQAVKKDDTYNNEAINNAKAVIQKLESGKTSKNYGAFQYEYKTKDNALGWMNYTIGYITYYRQDKKNESLPFLYKATQINSDTNKFSDIYRIIGAWYLEEALRIDKDRLAKIAAAENKDTDETLALLALQKGYADRSIDAYARAYSLASKDTKATKEYKDGLYGRLQDLYKFRYDGKVEGIDAYVSTVMNKPMPNPSTPVTPVAETAATATTTGTSTTPAATTTTPAATKPASKTMDKPATTPATTKPPTPTKPTSTTVTPKTDGDSSTQAATTSTKSKTTKKTTPKKKGTR